MWVYFMIFFPGWLLKSSSIEIFLLSNCMVSKGIVGFTEKLLKLKSETSLSLLNLDTPNTTRRWDRYSSFVFLSKFLNFFFYLLRLLKSQVRTCFWGWYVVGDTFRKLDFKWWFEKQTACRSDRHTSFVFFSKFPTFFFISRSVSGCKDDISFRKVEWNFHFVKIRRFQLL